MKVWMALDPETLRVTMQDREFSDGSLPRGLRGLGWSFREAEVDETDYMETLANVMPGHEVDEFHRAAWTAAGPTPWPNP